MIMVVLLTVLQILKTFLQSMWKKKKVMLRKRKQHLKPIIKMQKARRGKSFHGGSVNIRKLQNARVCIEKLKCSEEQLDQEIKGKVEESNKEENSDETKENR